MFIWKNRDGQWLRIVEEGGFSHKSKMVFTENINEAFVSTDFGIPYYIRRSTPFKRLERVEATVTRTVHIVGE